MIKPTVGRRLWYHNPELSDQPCDAGICYVHSDRMINIGGRDCNGVPFAETSVTLVQPGDEIPDYPYASWMPYQTRKDHGSESGEAEAGTDEV